MTSAKIAVQVSAAPLALSARNLEFRPQEHLFAAARAQSAAFFLRDDPEVLTLDREAGDRMPQAAVHAVEHLLHHRATTGAMLRNLEKSVRELPCNSPTPFGRNRQLAD